MMESVKEFLESSTIHGLSYISTSRKVGVKYLWVGIVITGFTISGILIFQSFKQWNKSPVGTSEETLPISEISFPRITVCPPKGTHTALNYFLDKLKHEDNFLDKETRMTLNATASKLVEERESWELMVDSLVFKERRKFRNWYEGITTASFQFERIRLPDSIMQTIENRASAENPYWVYSQNFRMETNATSGSIETPWFGRSYEKETFFPELDYRC